MLQSVSRDMALNNAQGLVMSLVLAAVVLGAGLFAMGDIYSKFDSNTSEGATHFNETTHALGSFSSWFSIFVTVTAAAIILGIVIRYFGRGGMV